MLEVIMKIIHQLRNWWQRVTCNLDATKLATLQSFINAQMSKIIMIVVAIILGFFGLLQGTPDTLG